MTTYEKCKVIRHAVLSRAAEVMVYQNWGEVFAAKQVRQLPKQMKSSGFKTVNVADLTASEMDELGFGRWDKTDTMRLIPLWLYPWLTRRVNLGRIDGKKSELKRSEMDTDNCYGWMAYGAWPKDAKSE